MNKKSILTAAAVFVAAFAAAANYHIVYGSTVDGVKFLRKVSPSISETFVNLDAVGNMPLLAVRARYPLFSAAIMREAEVGPRTRRAGCRELRTGMTRVQAVHYCGEPVQAEFRDSSGEYITFPGGDAVIVADGVVTEIIK